MYCVHCGAQILPGQRFCNKCGQPLVGDVASASPASPAPPESSAGQVAPPQQPSSIPAFPPHSRLARHLGTLGILWMIFSALRLIPGLGMLAFGHMHFPFLMMPFPHPMRLFAAPFLGAFGLLVSGYAIAGLIAGWGLIAHRLWARMLAIVLGCISLIHFPFGTMLGIYTLWVLVSQGADVEYQHLAAAN